MSELLTKTATPRTIEAFEAIRRVDEYHHQLIQFSERDLLMNDYQRTKVIREILRVQKWLTAMRTGLKITYELPTNHHYHQIHAQNLSDRAG